MAQKKKSWREKLAQSKDLPKTMVIPAPREVDEVMKQVPRGKVITIAGIGSALARKHGTMIACPMTTGIFAWIAAHAAEEAAGEGAGDVTPWWRTIKSDGALNEKYPGRGRDQRKRLLQEGHAVVRGRVKDFEKVLWNP